MTYTHGHHESVLRSHKWRSVDNSAAYLAPHLTSGTSVLDLGCGPGTITADFGRRVAPGRVLGIDASAAVIEEARREAGGGPNVEFSVGDLYALEMDDHDEPAIDRWLALYRTITRCNAGEPDAGRFLLAWAHAAGFDDVAADASVWCFATPDKRMVGWVMGRSYDRFGDRAPSGHRRPRYRDGVARDRRRMAPLGDAPRRLVRGPPRRDPLPRLAITGYVERDSAARLRGRTDLRNDRFGYDVDVLRRHHKRRLRHQLRRVSAVTGDGVASRERANLDVPVKLDASLLGGPDRLLIRAVRTGS